MDQYSHNFWNTVNPLHLAGTTLVSKKIGTGKPDSSGFAQGGDFRSGESWVEGECRSFALALPFWIYFD